MGVIYIDISMPLYDGMIHWPSDPPVRIEPFKLPEKGDRSTVSLFHMGSHTGTHVDTPRHFLPGRTPVDEMPLERLIGPCRVVDCRGRARIDRSAMEGIDLRAAPRVLFRTDNSDGWSERPFSKNYVALDEEAAQWLARNGAQLVGVDSLSVESADSAHAGAHHALLEAGVAVVEGLVLRDVPAGDYDLICLPLRFRGGDGAPARAVLVKR